MARILVTGAGGFIGRALCRALRRSGHEVRELARAYGDIFDPATLARVEFAEHVFHLAGRTFVPDSWTEPVEFHRVNTLGTASVLEFCRRHESRLTFVSAYLYGAPERLPVSEACVPRPNNPYALSKILAEKICEFYAEFHGIDVTVLRPFNIFGPGQKAHFLIPEIVAHVLARRTISVKDLAPRRDYLYISDLVDALMKTLDGPRGYNVFNIGSGSSLSVGELIAVVQSVAGTDLPVVSADEVRINEINDVYADTSRARALLAWEPKLTFRQGVEKIMLGETNS